MESNYKPFDHKASYQRMADILADADTNYTYVTSIPARSSLTYANGYSIQWIGAVFVDIRDSSSLSDNYRNSTLAKIYRAFISEVVAAMNGNDLLQEITIEGDCVAGVFDAKQQKETRSIFNTCAVINSTIKMLNKQLTKQGLKNIKVGIGFDIGRALMIKAGYSGSGINEIAWMGNVLNNAARMSNLGSKNQRNPLVVSPVVRNNLTEHQQGLVHEYDAIEQCYHGNVIWGEIDRWTNEQ